MTWSRGGTAVVAAVLLLAPLTGCTGAPSATPSATPTPGTPTPTTSLEPAYNQALSAPVEDSYYPAQGDPGLDALHYRLTLNWTPPVLHGTAEITFRAASTADQVRLDLLHDLRVSAVQVDGSAATWRQVRRGNDLVIDGAFEQDSRHVMLISYAGRPHPVPAPTTRDDFSTVGWNTMLDGEAWAMQEPFGSYSWYPSNDQPSDKALYDIQVVVPKRWVGITNGVLTGQRVQRNRRILTWHLSRPAATYLMTIAIGDYVRTQVRSRSGVPISYWTRRGDAGQLRAVRAAPDALAWIERRLGPYPFDSLGFVVVPGESGMETQTLITLGDTRYTTSIEVIQHELVHQWYGDLVTPTDWRDMWMNEGMTMFLQIAFEADRAGVSIDEQIRPYVAAEIAERADAGPPGAYDKGSFGSGNVYVSPALMWNEVRHQLGEAKFWELVRAWPRVHPYGNATRAQYYQWLQDEYGLDPAFLDAWIMGARTPERTGAG